MGAAAGDALLTAARRSRPTEGTASVPSVAETRPTSSANLGGSPTCSPPEGGSTQDVERRVALALSILDHGFTTRDRPGRDLDSWLRRVLAEARAALDGATIEQLLEARGI